MTTKHHTLRSRGWIAALALAVAPAAAQVTNSVRPVSLQECFDLALRENLDLQIERLNPMFSQIGLKTAWAGYDPSISLSGTHSDNVSAGGLDAEKRPYTGSAAESDGFASSIVGRGLYGLAYELGANLTDSHGTRPVETMVINTNGSVLTTNVVLIRRPFESTSGRIWVTLEQPLLKNFLFDDTRRSIAVARSNIRGSELGLIGQVINILTEVEKAYNDLIGARESIKVREEGLRLAQQLLADNKRRVQVGILAVLDEKQSESEVFARQTDLSSAKQLFATAQNKLKSLISSNSRILHDTTLQPVETLTAVPQTFDVYDSWNSGLTKRPDVLEARRQVEVKGIELKFAKNQRLPELNITGSYGYGANSLHEFSDSFQAIANQEQPNWSIGAFASMPLSNKAARENYKRAKLSVDQVLLLLKKQEQTVLVEIDDRINIVRTRLDQIASTRQARIYAAQALDGGQKRLQAGTTTSFEILQLQRDLITARTEEVLAITLYNNALAELFKSEGSTLERKKIEVQVK